MPNQARVSFPGVAQAVSATYTLQHGITPGEAIVETAPQANFVGAGGTLTFTFSRDVGGPVVIGLPNCKISRAEYRRGSDGKIWRLHILDRRWKWAFPAIGGGYNLRNERSEIVDDPTSPIRDTKRNARQLATLLLQAMNEVAFDVGGLPVDSFPTVEWDQDNAAQALAQLADDHGCRVVLGLDNAVHVVQANIGAPLPALAEAMDYSLTIDPPEKPDRFAVACARVRYQADLSLEAVGKDLDGTVKPIDRLSYKPAGGWQTGDPPHFNGIANVLARALAVESVFRWYRALPGFKLQAFDELGQAVEKRIDGLDEILPLEPDMAERLLDDGRWKERPAVVWGVWLDGTEGAVPQQPILKTLKAYDDPYALAAIYRDGYGIDAANGIVKFHKPVFRWLPAAGGFARQPYAAQLALRTAFHLRDAATRGWHRYLRFRNSGTAYGTGTAVVKRDDLVPVLVTDYAAGAQLVPGMPTTKGYDNLAAISVDAERALDGIAAQYAVDQPESALYAGLLAVTPDGAIQQVAWTVGPQGATTRVGRNKEVLTGATRPHKVRRFYERLRGTREPNLSGEVARRVLRRR